MDAPQCLTDFAARGIRLEVSDNKLRAYWSDAPLTDTDRANLRTHKAVLLHLLAPTDSPGATLRSHTARPPQRSTTVTAITGRDSLLAPARVSGKQPSEPSAAVSQASPPTLRRFPADHGVGACAAPHPPHANLSSLYLDLRARDMHLVVRGGKCSVDMPKGKDLTDADRASLRLHRAAIVRLLTPEPTPLPEAPPAPPPDAQHVPHPLRPGAEEPATVALVAWFLAQRGRLPVDPYILAPGVTVTAPPAFYAALAADCVAYPAGPRAHVLGDDLRALQTMLLALGGPTTPAAPAGHEGVAQSA